MMTRRRPSAMHQFSSLRDNEMTRHGQPRALRTADCIRRRAQLPHTPSKSIRPTTDRSSSAAVIPQKSWWSRSASPPCSWRCSSASRGITARCGPNPNRWPSCTGVCCPSTAVMNALSALDQGRTRSTSRPAAYRVCARLRREGRLLGRQDADRRHVPGVWRDEGPKTIPLRTTGAHWRQSLPRKQGPSDRHEMCFISKQ